QRSADHLHLHSFPTRRSSDLFLQSGIDKVVDRRGNLEFLQGHFAKSPLSGMVPLLVTLITILEVLAGGLSAIGCALIVFTHSSRSEEHTSELQSREISYAVFC